ncbi:MAG: glucose-6-phosphate isomerase [Parcubacteria group bacterium]|jgi:glucose-6-phosphate isomerase|nr:glucose-6-phosphate isomerase [Parcubacteria group bacterium]|tara:strand:- start:8408 stop:9121 length:714 start_codon:yes stop_codon:yes gene_type:complete
MDLKTLQPEIRHLKDMAEVLYDPSLAQTKPDLELYQMYRDLAENESDRQKMVKQELRYDITVLNPVILGEEFNKTAGHDHPLAPNTDMTYPELYQVLKGQVIFLLQDSVDDKIQDIYTIEVQQDDIVIIPPNYEHIMINASEQKAETANWITSRFSENIYESFRIKHGFGYYALKGQTNQINWVKNEHYLKTPQLKSKRPNIRVDEFKIPKQKPIYQLINHSAKLNFLKRPQDYDWS